MRVIISMLGAFCLLISGMGFATTKHHAVKTAVRQQAVQVIVYAAPQTTAAVVQKVSPTQRLIPVFRQGKWIKVGDPSNGKIGWVNRDQYQKALHAFYRPTMQTVLISTELNNNGKPTINVVAYKNGKKLSQKEANKLYKHIRKQRRRESRYMQHVFGNMDKYMDEQMRSMDYFMAPWDNVGFGFGPEIIQPVIVVNPAQQAAPAKHK